MDISLREWLIIGGVLIVILILVDGWRRVSANRSRLRLEIDRTLSELSEDDAPHNPELPNGGARLRDHEGQIQEEAVRVEPGFAEDRFSADPAAEALAEMDPLFDDIPPRTKAGRTEPATLVSNQGQTEPAAAGLSARDQRPEEVPSPADSVASELPELDLEQPIPVLFDEVNPADNPELPGDTLAAYRQSLDAADTQQQAEAEPTAPVYPPQIESADVQSPEPLAPTSEPVWSRDEVVVEPTEPSGRAEPADEPASEAVPASDETGAAGAAAAASSRGLKSMPDPEHVLIITVVGRNGQHLPGPALNRIVTACGMEWGDMAIYHRPEDSSADAPIQFSMANAVAPGTFDPDNLEALETPAVTFFMSLDEPKDAMTAYECMLATAETLAKHLNGDLLDDDRSVMRPQTKEHYRERIRDYEMHQRQRRAN